MIYYNPILKRLARSLRKNTTDSERKLWQKLRRRQLLGVQFYRQRPIGDYIVDFYAPRIRLVVEIDGSQHLEKDYASRDRIRDGYLDSLGLKVLRFNSREVLTNIEMVLDVLYRTMKERARI